MQLNITMEDNDVLKFTALDNYGNKVSVEVMYAQYDEALRFVTKDEAGGEIDFNEVGLSHRDG